VTFLSSHPEPVSTYSQSRTSGTLVPPAHSGDRGRRLTQVGVRGTLRDDRLSVCSLLFPKTPPCQYFRHGGYDIPPCRLQAASRVYGLAGDLDFRATRPDPNRFLILFTGWGSGTAVIVPSPSEVSMAAVLISTGQMAGSGACVPNPQRAAQSRFREDRVLVSDVLLIAYPRTRRAVQDFYATGQALPKVSRLELAGLLAGYAPNFA
jgi:hypothetical protein